MECRCRMKIMVFFEDTEAAKYIHGEDGITLWIRHVVWLDGPSVGVKGYVVSLRTPGRVRNSSVISSLQQAITLGKLEMDKMIEQRK